MGPVREFCAGMVRASVDGAKLLADWRHVAKRMFPKDHSLEEEIPHPRKIHLGRLAQYKPWLIGGGCLAVALFRECFERVIKEAALCYDLTPEQIKVYKMDCWQHLRCVWSGEGLLDLKEYMTEFLANDLAVIHPILRVTTDISNPCLAVKKYFVFKQTM